MHVSMRRMRSRTSRALIQVSERSVPVTGRRRAGRGRGPLSAPAAMEQALERFEQSHKVFQPRAWDWLFLAMIHSRLGHTSEARRCLQQADEWIVEADKAPSGTEKEGPRWSNLVEKPTILLLRSEAEAVIRFDPVFPANPFAP